MNLAHHGVARLDAGQVAKFLRTPDHADNKYRRGVVTLVTGSATYPGAGVLSAGGASRSGVGMVRHLGSSLATQAVLTHYPECVFTEGRRDAAVIGCGWAEDLAAAAEKVISQGGPLVLDAGVLDRLDLWLDRAEGPRVLTPHYGEAARLWKLLEPSTNATAEMIAENPAAATRSLAELSAATVVLKGAATHVADPAGPIWEFAGLTGWAGVAGSGDVLAGVIGSLLAQRQADARYRGVPVEAAKTAAVAVWLHGNAAAVAAKVSRQDTAGSKNLGRPIVAHEIAAALPDVWQAVS